MSFSSNFKTRMLFLDQSYNVTKHRWLLFEKIWLDGQRIGMRMKMRQEPGEVVAETFVDGRIVLYSAFLNMAYSVQNEILDAIREVAVLVKEDADTQHTWQPFKRRVYQRKVMYTSDSTITGSGDFADFLAKKFQGGSQESVQSSRR